MALRFAGPSISQIPGYMKQSITALSTCEAEYIAATAAVQQTAWLRLTL